MPRLCGQQVAAEGERIPSGRMRQLVDEAFDVEAGDAVADRAPEADGYAEVLHHVLDAAVGRGVGRLDRTLDRGRIDAVLQELREHPGHDRGGDDLAVPARDFAGGVETGAQPGRGDRKSTRLTSSP